MEHCQTDLKFFAAAPTLLVCLAGIFPPAVEALDRLPLQKKKIEIGQPAPMDKEFSGYDKDGNPVYWDPRPRVVPLGNGKYAFKWIGHRGRELTLIYHRPDSVDVLVKALVTPENNKRFVYQYEVRNLKTSKDNLSAFMVRVFGANVEAASDPSILAINPLKLLKQDFPEGAWISFSPFTGKRQIRPGDKLVVTLSSPHLPALLDCLAHAGTLTIEGVGEEPPGVFERLMLGRDAWPHGYTIGPDERLAKMGLQGRLNYLVIRLPQMLELGWIENEKILQWYKENLLAGKAAEVRARAEADFKRNLITSEVLALMTYLTR